MYIEEVSKVNKNGKEFFKLKIDGKSFTAFDSSDAFGQLESGEVKSNMEAKVEFSEKEGSFNGKPVTYRNVNKFSDVKTVEKKDVLGSKVSGPDWDAKDRRIVRMASVSRAIEFFEMNKNSIVGESGVSEESVLGLAKKFEEWVYRK